MLAATAPAAHTRALAHDLRDQALHIARASEEVAVAAVIAKDQIAVTQFPANRHAGEFLPNASMHRAEELSCSKQLEQLLFDTPNQQRGGIKLMRL